MSFLHFSNLFYASKQTEFYEIWIKDSYMSHHENSDVNTCQVTWSKTTCDSGLTPTLHHFDSTGYIKYKRISTTAKTTILWVWTQGTQGSPAGIRLTLTLSLSMQDSKWIYNVCITGETIEVLFMSPAMYWHEIFHGAAVELWVFLQLFWVL